MDSTVTRNMRLRNGRETTKSDNNDNVISTIQHYVLPKLIHTAMLCRSVTPTAHPVDVDLLTEVVQPLQVCLVLHFAIPRGLPAVLLPLPQPAGHGCREGGKFRVTVLSPILLPSPPLVPLMV